MKHLEDLTVRIKALMRKMRERPGELNPADMHELALFDPWYAKCALAYWRRYQREQAYEVKFGKRLRGALPRRQEAPTKSIPVVRIDPRFRR